jgi:hypothetical protein
MRLSGLRLHREKLSGAGILLHRVARSQLHSSCSMYTGFAHLAMPIAGMRRRADCRKQNCGEEHPQE